MEVNNIVDNSWSHVSNSGFSYIDFRSAYSTIAKGKINGRMNSQKKTSHSMHVSRSRFNLGWIIYEKKSTLSSDLNHKFPNNKSQQCHPFHDRYQKDEMECNWNATNFLYVSFDSHDLHSTFLECHLGFGWKSDWVRMKSTNICVIALWF